MSIKEKLQEDPAQAESWRPDPGDEIIGVVQSVRSRDAGTGYGAYPIVVVKLDDGKTVAFHAFHTVARNQLDDEGVRVGDEIGVKYLGLVDGESHSYHSYRIVAERTAASAPNAQGYSIADQESIGATQAAAEEDIPF